MKLRAIELTNLRRFAGQRARIDGIGDGISVLSECNEYGKSTFFDGLRAVFFEPHRGTRAAIRALQPHGGGAPEAAVEIDLPQGRFRIEKRWLSRPTAQVTDATGRMVARDDEAEAWIDGLTQGGLAGPSGLLWVRQGLLGIEPDAKGDAGDPKSGLSVRRDLLSSVAGEIELMTGGRRMDAVLVRVREALDRLATRTLRPKSGGPWARAVEEADALEAERAALDAKARGLAAQLQTRARLGRERKALTDPEADARDTAALRTAEAALEAATRRADEIRAADSACKLALRDVEKGRSDAQALAALRDRLAEAETRATRSAAAVTTAEAGAGDRAAEVAQATRAHDTAAAAAKAATAQLEAAQRAAHARTARDLAQTLAQTLARAEAQRSALEEQRARRKALVVTAQTLAAAEAAQAALDRLRAQAEAQQVAVRFDYDGAARVTLAGRPLGPGGVRLTGATTFELPGIGRMTVDPGAAGEGALAPRITAAEAALAKALAACGAPDLRGAQRAADEARHLDGAIRDGAAALAESAPDGIEALRLKLAQAREAAGAGADDATDDPAPLEAALAAARADEAAAAQALAAATARQGQAREDLASAKAAAGAAQDALDRVRSEAGDAVTLAARLLTLGTAQPALEAALADAEARRAALAADAPDEATARAEVARLGSVLAGRAQERTRLDRELAEVNGSIGALADQGIEEALDEITGRAAEAAARAARYEREVGALDRLRRALEDARMAAREQYLRPVMDELRPLLDILHPGAELGFDDTSLLPATLTRAGQDEALDILSGGTREQLAVLTRLAFARLFLRRGQPVPVVLDDALVHSDDDRIEAMFTALHRVAQDQQILVFTCRQRAFAPLGGQRLRVEVTPA
ncbi:AAA family ATPase [Paracoccus sanguinis]|uniref:AAA family ATPase n=1 Tax=Paracoccus sanguinis TaxID=1545044 RepID=UPI00051F8CA8|nr:hypothetical protein [Paracoccus sanguinis]KGJ21680.1 hypothetical protein IX55_00855 [Paracoccus sanguinis]